ncbi:MAG: SDR family NAD(P)-dependent oxidoreductase [Elsteraceae bacterium]
MGDVLKGKAAVVTGGAAGLGLAIARRLKADGAAVSLWDRDASALERAEGFDRRRVDVSDARAVDRAARETKAALGGLDILVANAGILGPVAPTWEVTPEQFRAVTEVNLVGAFLCLRAVTALMMEVPREKRWGRIVTIASIQGKEGTALASAYAASKAGLIGLTKVIGKELATEGILVNCVAPVAIATAMMQEITEQRKAELLARIPMGRFPTVEEAAEMVAWLCSPACSFSTGAVFDLSGGRATF